MSESSQPLTHRVFIAPAFLPDTDSDESARADDTVGANDASGAAAPEAAPNAESDDAPPNVAPAGEPKPAGEGLADLLVAGLAARGWTIEYRWATYQGHAFDARRGEHRYDVEVDLLDKPGDTTGRWLLTAKRRTGLFKRIFQGGVDPAEQEMLRRDLDTVLAADGRITGEPIWVDEANFRG